MVTEEGTSGAARSQRRADADADESAEPARTRDDGRPSANERASAGNRPRARARSHNGGRASATSAARRAAEAVAELTGRDVETVISIEPSDAGWKIGVEVVETRRIPDSADILASYEVQLDSGGDLVSYRRTHRYARSQLYGARR
jgi:Gas vesicle synthesis protein GvpO